MVFDYDYLFGLSKTLLTTVMTLLLIFVLIDFKFSRKKVLAVYSAYLVYVGISSWILINLFGWLNFMRLFIFTIIVPALVITYFMATDRAMQAVFNYASQIDIVLILSATATLINTAFHGNRISDLLLRTVLLAAVSLLEYRYARKPFRRVADNLALNWGILAAIPVCFCILLIVCGLFPVHFIHNLWGTVQIYVIALVMTVIYISVFKSFMSSYQYMESRQQNDLLAAQVLALQKHADTLLLHSEQDALYRNNAHYQAQTLYAMLKNKEVDMAADFLSRSMDHEPSEPIPCCSNLILNDLLTYYLTEAKEQGILIKTNLHFPPNLPVDVMELAAVFANAIENAIDAMGNMPETQEKRLELYSTDTPKFILEVSNTCPEAVSFDEDGIPVNEKNRYGIHTQGILAFTNKHDAVLDYEVLNGMFHLRLLIQDTNRSPGEKS